MAAIFADSIRTEYYNGSAWVDLSSYVVGNISGSGGLGGWKPGNRVAGMGTLQLTLNNKAKLFSPMGGDVVRSLNTLSGFTKGAKLRVSAVIGTRTWVIWAGWISSIDSDDKNWGKEQTRVSCVDWMDVPARYPMKGATLALNRTLKQGINLILARTPLQPYATDLDSDSFVFPQIFDNVQNRTTAIGELNKLTLSELGYLYLKNDGTLRAENANTRPGTRPLSTAELHPNDYAYLLKEDGDFLLLETGDQIILDDNAAVALGADAESYTILLDPNSMLNSATVRAYPPTTDTTLKVLYSLGTPIKITPGSTVRFTAHYRNPDSLLPICGDNMQTPTATTDFLANSKSDGTGTDHTADVNVVASYRADSVAYAIKNLATETVYITFLQARGYGIYFGNSIESQVDDTASQNANGLIAFSLDQRYQHDPYTGYAFATAMVEEYKDPKSRITKMSYLANLNKAHLMAFLSLAIGSLITVTEDRSALANYYYITDRSFTIRQGGIINVTYGLKQHDSYLSGALNPVTVEFTGGGTDALDYGNLPRVLSLTRRSFAAWIWLDTAPSTVSYAILSTFTDNSGAYLSIETDRSVKFYQKANGAAVWQTNASLVPTGAWTHIVVTRDSTLPGTRPIFYIDGTLRTTNETIAQDGDVIDESSAIFMIGNLLSDTLDYARPFDGKIFDARVYDHELTQAEVTALYNGGTASALVATDGLLFQGPAVNADLGDDASLAGTVLSSAYHLLDNAYRAVGVPHSAPVLRANP